MPTGCQRGGHLMWADRGSEAEQMDEVVGSALYAASATCLFPAPIRPSDSRSLVRCLYSAALPRGVSVVDVSGRSCGLHRSPSS